MTITEFLTLARESYNAVGDTFWSDNELLGYAYIAELAIARNGLDIERTFTTDSVNGQSEYDYPTNAIQIKRLTYNGAKLQPSSFGEWDALTAMDEDSTTSGEPQYYIQWNDVFILYPTPDTDGTDYIKVRAIVRPTRQSATGAFSVDEQWHPIIMDHTLYRMAVKDQNMAVAKDYKDSFERGLLDVLQWRAKKKRGDRFAIVKITDARPWTVMGSV